MKYNDQEMNDLSYKYALKYDKRTYCEYYIPLIKITHFSFFIQKFDFNSRITKNTLLHELGHAVDENLNCSLSGNDNFYEIFIQIFSIIQYNPYTY